MTTTSPHHTEYLHNDLAWFRFFVNKEHQNTMSNKKNRSITFANLL
ncbi:hypothetical protein FHS19_000361 [Paenibacillus rhizosphaerae]|uniref:Uncharacterized protein n=1 Tax=Paenibacillus rhizosphaerae TaxID=297318 RepID=A0A839TLK9_9BACL|nr:hypothetical protein [Paenibacillus rhizosphaerae]